MRLILNGKEIKNVEVLKFENEKSKYIGYEIRNKSGKRWSLVRNRMNDRYLGVVKHGSMYNHKFRGYEWMSDETGDLVGVC